MQCSTKEFPKEISIPYALFQSEKGRYFIGQTPVLTGENGKALVALVNPIVSKVNIFVNAITVTNTSELNLSAEFYLKSSFSGALTSNLFSCANTSIAPQPIPKGLIQYLPTTTTPPSGGVSIFSRIISPFSTVVVDGGQIILSPGESLTVYLGNLLPIKANSTIVAFGWWEEKISNCCSYTC